MATPERDSYAGNKEIANADWGCERVEAQPSSSRGRVPGLEVRAGGGGPSAAEFVEEREGSTCGAGAGAGARERETSAGDEEPGGAGDAEEGRGVRRAERRRRERRARPARCG